MSLRLLRAVERRPRPWKNRGGETIEIAASPAGAGLDDFDWRLSMATVAAPGPFSAFDGVDRTLAVLSGRLMLALDGGQSSVQLDPQSPPFEFAGGLEVYGAPLSGAVTDLNLMVRRGRYVGSMTRLRPVTPVSLVAAADVTIALFTDLGRLTWRALDLAMAPRDAVMLPDTPAETFEVESAGDVYIIAVSPSEI